MLLIRHLTRDLLWRPDTVVHPNHAVALIEAVYATDAPAETMARLSRLAGRPAEPDPLGGYRIPLSRGCLRILPHAVAAELFPEMADGPSLIGLTIAVEAVTGAPQEITGEISHAAPGKGTPGRPADERPNNEWPTGGWPPARRASAGQMTIGEIATAQATAGQPASGGTPIGRATHAGGVVIRWIVGSV